MEIDCDASRKHIGKRVKLATFNDFFLGAACNKSLFQKSNKKNIFQKIPTRETRNSHVIKLNSFVYVLRRWKNFSMSSLIFLFVSFYRKRENKIFLSSLPNSEKI